jgi:hypothetical protein
MAPRFSYSRVPLLGDHSIRLIHLQPSNTSNPNIECEIRPAQRNDGQEYEALSYTWGGGGDGDERHILLNGKGHMVGENLWQALQRLRLGTKPRVLWIDAICIDQKSDQERSQQVAQMAEIYKRARVVVAWLGPGTEESHIAINLLKEFFDGDTASLLYKYCRNSATEKTLETLVALHKRPYWNRLWIIPELMLASKVLIYWGDDEIDWQILSTVWRKLKYEFENDWEGIYTLSSFVKSSLGQLVELYDVMRHPKAQELSLVNLILLFHEAQCKDPRDRIFGYRSLAPSCCQQHISVDYSKSIDDIWRTTLTHHFSHHGSSVLPCARLEFCKEAARIVLGDKPALKIKAISSPQPKLEFLDITGSIQGKIKYLSPPLNILKGGDIRDIGRAPRLPRQLLRVLEMLWKHPFLALSSDISAVKYLGDSDSYAQRNSLSFRDMEPRTLSTSLPHSPLDIIIECIWFLMDRGKKSAAYCWSPRDVKLFIEENGMVGFAPAQSQLGDLVCRFKKEIFDSEIVSIVRESRSRKSTLIGTAVYYTDSVVEILDPHYYYDLINRDLIEDAVTVDEDIGIRVHDSLCICNIRLHLTMGTLQVMSQTTSEVRVQEEEFTWPNERGYLELAQAMTMDID